MALDVDLDETDRRQIEVVQPLFGYDDLRELMTSKPVCVGDGAQRRDVSHLHGYSQCRGAAVGRDRAPFYSNGLSENTLSKFWLAGIGFGSNDRLRKPGEVPRIKSEVNADIDRGSIRADILSTKWISRSLSFDNMYCLYFRYCHSEGEMLRRLADSLFIDNNSRPERATIE